MLTIEQMPASVTVDRLDCDDGSFQTFPRPDICRFRVEVEPHESSELKKMSAFQGVDGSPCDCLLSQTNQQEAFGNFGVGMGNSGIAEADKGKSNGATRRASTITARSSLSTAPSTGWNWEAEQVGENPHFSSAGNQFAESTEYCIEMPRNGRSKSDGSCPVKFPAAETWFGGQENVGMNDASNKVKGLQKQASTMHEIGTTAGNQGTWMQIATEKIVTTATTVEADKPNGEAPKVADGDGAMRASDTFSATADEFCCLFNDKGGSAYFDGDKSEHLYTSGMKLVHRKKEQAQQLPQNEIFNFSERPDVLALKIFQLSLSQNSNPCNLHKKQVSNEVSNTVAEGQCMRSYVDDKWTQSGQNSGNCLSLQSISSANVVGEGAVDWIRLLPAAHIQDSATKNNPLDHTSESLKSGRCQPGSIDDISRWKPEKPSKPGVADDSWQWRMEDFASSNLTECSTGFARQLNECVGGASIGIPACNETPVSAGMAYSAAGIGGMYEDWYNYTLNDIEIQRNVGYMQQFQQRQHGPQMQAVSQHKHQYGRGARESIWHDGQQSVSQMNKLDEGPLHQLIRPNCDDEQFQQHIELEIRRRHSDEWKGPSDDEKIQVFDDSNEKSERTKWGDKLQRMADHSYEWTMRAMENNLHGPENSFSKDNDTALFRRRYTIDGYSGNTSSIDDSLSRMTMAGRLRNKNQSCFGLDNNLTQLVFQNLQAPHDKHLRLDYPQNDHENERQLVLQRQELHGNKQITTHMLGSKLESPDVFDSSGVLKDERLWGNNFKSSEGAGYLEKHFQGIGLGSFKPREGQALYTLIVNVPVTTTRQELQNAFLRFGRVALTVVVCEKEHRHPNKEWTATSGYGFVRFMTTIEGAIGLAAATWGLVRIRGSRIRATWAKKDSLSKHTDLNATAYTGGVSGLASCVDNQCRSKLIPGSNVPEFYPCAEALDVNSSQNQATIVHEIHDQFKSKHRDVKGESSIAFSNNNMRQLRCQVQEPCRWNMGDWPPLVSQNDLSSNSLHNVTDDESFRFRLDDDIASAGQGYFGGETRDAKSEWTFNNIESSSMKDLHCGIIGGEGKSPQRIKNGRYSKRQQKSQLQHQTGNDRQQDRGVHQSSLSFRQSEGISKGEALNGNSEFPSYPLL